MLPFVLTCHDTHDVAAPPRYPWPTYWDLFALRLYLKCCSIYGTVQRLNHIALTVGQILC